MGPQAQCKESVGVFDQNARFCQGFDKMRESAGVFHASLRQFTPLYATFTPLYANLPGCLTKCENLPGCLTKCENLTPVYATLRHFTALSPLYVIIRHFTVTPLYITSSHSTPLYGVATTMVDKGLIAPSRRNRIYFKNRISSRG